MRIFMLENYNEYFENMLLRTIVHMIYIFHTFYVSGVVS